METTDTTKSQTFVTMDEFLEHLETRGSRKTTSPGASTSILGYPPAVAAPEAADEVLTPPGDRTWLVAYLRFRNEILDAPETTETDLHPETVNAFRQIWQGALEIGRKGEADKTAEARAEVEALSREAERLETESGLLENQLAETRHALNRALEDATTARQEAREARGTLASEQAKATQFEREKSDLFQQIADLLRILSDEKSQASKLEGQLEMMETKVIPQIAEVRQSLNRALEDAMAARQEAKEERAAVAAEQAKVAELLIQIADLQRVLGDEKGGMRRGAARSIRNPSTRIQSHC